MSNNRSHRALPHSLFISDLHLCDDRPDLNAGFVAFCQQRAIHAEQLFILGDLSDAWVGDDDDAQTATIIRRELAALADAGVAVHLMTGNRDFLMGEQLAAECKIGLLEDPSIVTLYGSKVLLMHGDSLCIDDAEYMAFRAQIRNREAQQQLLAQSLEQRRAIAVALRSQSKSANASKAEDIMDVSPSEVARVMQAQGVTRLIHGHTHRPAVHNIDLGSGSNSDNTTQSAERMVLGDWGERGWCIHASAQGFHLESFALVELDQTADFIAN